MSEKEVGQQEIEHQVDESVTHENFQENDRNITKMQAPDQWPEPPEDSGENSDTE